MNLQSWDVEWFRRIHVDLHREWLDPILFAITNSGLGLAKGLVIIPFLILQRTRPDALIIAIATIGTGLLRLPFMRLIGRMRPSNYEWATPLENTYSHETSFPSGHTATTFAAAMSFWLLVRKTEYEWIGWVLWGWAILVGFSRIYVGVHYPTDVIAGAAFGMLFGGLITLWLLENRSRLRWVSKPADPELPGNPPPSHP